jgi:hypothetical protein
MPGADQGGVELGEHLLGAANGINSDRCERKRDAEDAQAHS